MALAGAALLRVRDECLRGVVRLAAAQRVVQLPQIFETRRVHNDITFIDAFFTEEFCHERKFFTYQFNPERGVYEIADRNWKSVKQKLLFGLTNFGQPFIYVMDGNFENRGELLLEHRHEGIDLRVDYAKDTLQNLFTIWSRPVHLKTMVEGKGKLLTFDGEKHIERKGE